jgi:hypothetical protein
MSAAELASQIDVPVNRITGIVNGQRGVPPTRRFASMGVRAWILGERVSIIKEILRELFS